MLLAALIGPSFAVGMSCLSLFMWGGGCMCVIWGYIVPSCAVGLSCVYLCIWGGGYMCGIWGYMCAILRRGVVPVPFSSPHRVCTKHSLTRARAHTHTHTNHTHTHKSHTRLATLLCLRSDVWAMSWSSHIVGYNGQKQCLKTSLNSYCLTPSPTKNPKPYLNPKPCLTPLTQVATGCVLPQKRSRNRESGLWFRV